MNLLIKQSLPKSIFSNKNTFFTDHELVSTKY